MITSYFVWVSLKKIAFMNLFVSLQKIIRENWLEKSVKLQNPATIHTTLYYFWRYLSEEQISLAKDEIDKIRSELKDDKIILKDFRYFLHWEKAIFYIAPETDIDLQSFNRGFEELFHEESDKNKLAYIPHITIMRIKDISEYERFKTLFENEVRWFLRDFWKLDYLEDVNLYCVNSDYDPEMQISIY
ncbi:MAG: hypothetical protein ACD_2C00264G0010 [uncultured bacterium (gcode 4)]|uniref:A-kinase anchor protein 7-like phosphoesterase domain-containing protein n=1 Tax=uncultured bacterium (gcode 4) TaxID=1234023 RepID=K2GZH7_9BACT|nr:MAG: hypothetical protein ACD_2C00264G0010 [uncultured bacterium (gcode 4)]